ncbi:hypothetical protein [Castellaniella ginsengisoli]|uniref:Uncharacterized protein n=1 Tax=Castellaniella ginsengisoli TaxID=546114 RepID=A0AB39D8B3_9BURK
MKSRRVVYPADINLDPGGDGQLVLALTLPGHVTKLFVGGLSSMAVKCRVYRLSVGFFVGFVVLQVQSHQVRVVVPLYDEKSFSWLEQCLSRGTVSCMFTRVDAGDGQPLNIPTDFPALKPDNLAQMRRFSRLAPEDVLLVIASSVPSMLQPNAVDSLSGAEVEAVNVCIARDFFNTEVCKLAAAELLSGKVKRGLRGTDKGK